MPLFYSMIYNKLFKLNIPELNDYNAQHCHKAEKNLAPKSALTYLALTSMEPTDSVMNLTSICLEFEVTRVQFRIY